MRIMMLGDGVYPDSVGGSWRFLHDLASGLAGLGHRIAVLVPSSAAGRPEFQKLNGFELWRYGRPGSGAGRQMERIVELRRLMGRLESRGWDLLNYHFAWPAAAAMASLPGILPHARRVYTFQGPWCEEYMATLRGTALSPLKAARAGVSYRMRKAAEGYLLRGCRRVLVLSNFSRETIRRIHGPGFNVTVMKGGIRPETTMAHLTRAEARRRLGLDTSGRIIFTVRRLSPRMGLDLLIEAMSLLRRLFGDVRLIIGGRGESQAALSDLIVRLGLEETVAMAGFIPEEQLALYLRAADLVVMPSLELEGFGLVTLQAIMNGTPVMGTPIGGNRELIGSMGSRFLFNGLTPSSLAEGLADFCINRRSYPGDEEVLDFYRQHYDWEKVLAQWEREMFEMLNAKC